MTGYASGSAVWLFTNSLVFAKSLTQAAQETQVDQEVDERVLIGDGLAVAQVRSLDAQRHGMATASRRWMRLEARRAGIWRMR